MPTGVPRASGDLFCPPLSNLYSVDGGPIGFPYTVDTETTEADPGSGYLRFNNAVQASATELYVNDLSISETDMSEILTSLITGVMIRVVARGDATRYLFFRSTGSPTEEDGYWVLPVENIFATDSAPFDDDEIITISLEYSAAHQVAGGPHCFCLDYIFDGGVSDVDPGTGQFRFNNEGMGATTEIYVSDTDASAFNAISLLEEVGESYDIRGQVRLCKKGDPSSWAIFNITDSTVDADGYKKLQVEYVTSTTGGIGAIPWDPDDEICICFIFGQDVVSGGGSGGGVAISAASASVSSGTVVFSNSNNMSFGMSGSTITGQAPVNVTAANVIGGGGNATNISFVDAAGASYVVSSNGSQVRVLHNYAAVRNLSAGTQSANFSVSNATLVFADSNGVSFGLSGNSRITASFSSPTVVNSGLLNASGGGSSANVSRLVFTNSNNVSFSLSTGASVGTLRASAAVNFSGGSVSTLASNIVFSNANNVTFGMNGATLTASASVSQPTVVNSGLLNVSATGSSVNASRLVFTNTNNVGFALSTGGSVGTIRAAASISFSAGTQNNLISNLVFSNGNGVSFGMNASTLTASVQNSGFLLASHLGGNSANVTRMAFSNANNVTFSLSTAASAATVIASVVPPVPDPLTFRFTWSSSTSGQPAAGVIRGSSAAPTSNSELAFRVSSTDLDGRSVGQFLLDLDPTDYAVASLPRGIVILQSPNDPSETVKLTLNTVTSDGLTIHLDSTYMIATNGGGSWPWSNGETIIVKFIPAGASGSTGGSLLYHSVSGLDAIWQPHDSVFDDAIGLLPGASNTSPTFAVRTTVGTWGQVNGASQSEMEAANTTTSPVVPARQHFHPSAAKAWGVADGDGVGIPVSYNIDSIDDTATGVVTINILSDMSSANYAAVATAWRLSGQHYACGTDTHLAGSFRIVAYEVTSGAIEDPDAYSFAVYGDL